MQTRLPPLPALEAFDAAARHMSFKAAAAELHLTPSAVSHRIRQLERHLGQPLFRRLNREIRLTPAGEDFFATVRKSFDALSRAAQRIGRGSRPREELHVSMVPYFAAACVIPHLSDFLNSQPGLRLYVENSTRNADFARDAVDAGVRFGDGRWPGLAAVKLTDLAVAPVCRPDIAALLRRPADLAGQTLIHVTSFADPWPRWLEAAGLAGLKPKREVWVDSLTQSIDAAEAGLGVALGAAPLAAGKLAEGRLAMPLAPLVPIAHGFWFVCRRADAGRPRLVALRDWLLGRLARARAEMAPLAPADAAPPALPVPPPRRRQRGGGGPPRRKSA